MSEVFKCHHSEYSVVIKFHIQVFGCIQGLVVWHFFASVLFKQQRSYPTHNCVFLSVSRFLMSKLCKHTRPRMFVAFFGLICFSWLPVLLLLLNGCESSFFSFFSFHFFN